MPQRPPKTETEEFRSESLDTELTTGVTRSRLGRAFSLVSDLLLNAVTIVVLVIVIRYVFISPFEVKGDSMEPNFHTNDLLIVDKISYRFGEPQRGDVVVLVPPLSLKTKEYYVKRIVAVPGEEIQFRNGRVVIYNATNPEGLTLEESYIPPSITTNGQSSERVKVPENSYYVLGDNRPNSNDSRFWGVLPRSNIVGKAWVVLFPLSDLAVLKHPSY